MTNNSSQIISRMQASFPYRYNIYDENTILYALISTIGERYGTRTDIIDRLYAMIGIDSTYDEDLEHRWGSLLGIYRRSNESYDDYRNRLLIVYSSLAGGTADAIKYAIASVIGVITDADSIDNYIKVYDAWEYPHEIDTKVITDTSYGHIICTIDLQVNENAVTMHDKIMNAINTTKSSGIYPYLLFIYNVNESADLKYAEEDVIGKIVDGSTDTVSMPVEADNLDMIIMVPYSDNTTIFKSSVWSSIGGTNTDAVLNDGFITNMFMEVDEHSDVIIYGVTVLGEAILGAAAIGVLPS
jgi:hypothetical protein